MKRLNWKDKQRRRAQGLCFNCDEKFTVDHKCRGPKLLLLEGSYSSNAEDETNEETIIEPHISLHALTGWTMSRTMRVLARIGPYEVAVLIDSGYTHNFISEKVPNLLQLPVVPTRPFNTWSCKWESIKIPREVWACVGLTSRYLIFSYSFFLVIGRVRLGVRHTMARAIGNNGLQLERFDNAVPVEKPNSQVTRDWCTSHSICIVKSDFQRLQVRTFFVCYLPTTHNRETTTWCTLRYVAFDKSFWGNFLGA